MLLSKLQKPIKRFLIVALIGYIIWKLLYDLIIFPYTKLDLVLINNYIKISKSILTIMGYSVYTGGERLIGIDGTSGLWIGDSCDGMELFALFSIFIISFPGKNLNKILYCIAGICFIYFLNILRIVALAVIQVHTSREWTEFNHTYTFTILIYSVIFILWMLWVKKFNGQSTT